MLVRLFFEMIGQETLWWRQCLSFTRTENPGLGPLPVGKRLTHLKQSKQKGKKLLHVTYRPSNSKVRHPQKLLHFEECNGNEQDNHSIVLGLTCVLHR